VAGAPVDLLQRVPLFADLGRRELEQVASSMKERRFEEGETLTVEGRGGVGFFVIEEGDARVSVHGDDRGKLGSGDYFGEIALISEGSRTATITAETPVKAWGMTMWDFRPLVEGNAQMSWKMLQAMAKQLHAAESRAAGAAS
jgi:CRP/FNR family transcriptional regulator, cyclic AMP receptor protein